MTTQAEVETKNPTDQVDLEAVATPEIEAGDGASDTQEPEGEETIVSIGEEAPPPEETTQAPEWVRELRRKQRETAKENGELKKKLEALTVQPAPTLGKKPTLEDCDYDADRFESELASWFEQKRKADEEEAKLKQAEETAKADWNSKLENYGKAKSDLRLKDFDEAEAEAMEVFSVTQQGIVIQGSDNPALVIYAVGKNIERGKELASIKDPVKFAFAVAKLEAQLKVTKKNSPPPPERQLNGTGRVSGAVDSTLERLEAEAAKTGDRTKIIQYKAQQRAKSNK